MQQILKVNTYEVWVSLGCSKEEQSFVQPVHFNVSVTFSEAVKGCLTDHLSDAVDYVSLTNRIKNVAQSKSFHLIEHLCFLVHQDLYMWLQQQNYKGVLNTEVKKLRPPVAHVQGGVEFQCQSNLLS
ncbi:MAG: dihydroneopterin aldolase [Pseudobdellovibrio sp.]